MKRKLFTSLFATIVLFGVGIFATGCGPSDTLSRLEVQRMIEENNQNLEFTQWEVVNFEVSKSSWEWNEGTGQYEFAADLPELTEFIYEKGAALGYVFIGDRGKGEVQKLLPYVNTYIAEDNAGNPVTFTETISCDFQYGTPSSVGFSIKASDLAKDPEAPQNYMFRIVLLW